MWIGRMYTSKSKFSQNTTILLLIKVATCFDSRSHQANCWTIYVVHQVKVHIFGIPKYLQQWEKVGTNEVNIYNILYIKIQGKHKLFPWLQTFIIRKLRGIETYFFKCNWTQEVFLRTYQYTSICAPVCIPCSFLVINVCNQGTNYAHPVYPRVSLN
jgi:hypothetical protein